ncbi:hypothetical protein KOW79_015754 [Hemibagrus wyckioides]|uniref:Uncharacterized protein n=1 Tax=Hemibagrus wyckioides TaxID=337641 RepID=A0A9D3NF94_9TELE|nr:hypothetical protein KOW79_015754 [Hemibagrus wyckioides]
MKGRSLITLTLKLLRSTSLWIIAPNYDTYYDSFNLTLDDMKEGSGGSVALKTEGTCRCQMLSLTLEARALTLLRFHTLSRLLFLRDLITARRLRAGDSSCTPGQKETECRI